LAEIGLTTLGAGAALTVVGVAATLVFVAVAAGIDSAVAIMVNPLKYKVFITDLVKLVVALQDKVCYTSFTMFTRHHFYLGDL
jgi:flavoprotein